mmetsp:Transcript_35820/g.80672  ORF Transcript_35820/g.80672 Transcript_35820/m.80672 type:complete len:143 (+) Transcript_35820:72-500(+)
MPPKTPPQSNKITDVFKVKKKRGRPRTKPTLETIVETGGGKKAKPAPKPAPKPARGRPVQAAASSEHVSKKPKTRANYNMPGPAKGKMDAAVLEWVNGPPPEDIANGKELSEKSLRLPRACPSRLSTSTWRRSRQAGNLFLP